MASPSDWRANPLYYGIRKVGTLFLQQPRKRGDVLPSYYCKIAGKLGETRYRKLCNDTRLVLEEIFICQEELELVGTCLRSIRRRLNPNHNETEEKRRLIDHVFLILKIQPGEGPALHIKAAKLFGVDDEGNGQGIHISVEADEDDRTRAMLCRCGLHSIECSIGVRLDSLIAVLKKWNPYYDVKRDNCWDYARETTKLLLGACMEIVGSGHPKHKRLVAEGP